MTNITLIIFPHSLWLILVMEISMQIININRCLKFVLFRIEVQRWRWLSSGVLHHVVW
jgi:hypothetical protein